MDSLDGHRTKIRMAQREIQQVKSQLGQIEQNIQHSRRQEATLQTQIQATQKSIKEHEKIEEVMKEERKTNQIEQIYDANRGLGNQLLGYVHNAPNEQVRENFRRMYEEQREREDEWKEQLQERGRNLPWQDNRRNDRDNIFDDNEQQ